MKHLSESLIKNVNLGVENTNKKYFDSLMEDFEHNSEMYDGFINSLLNATSLGKLKDEKFLKRALKKTYNLKGEIYGDFVCGSVYVRGQKYEDGDVGGIHRYIEFEGEYPNKYFDPIKIYQYGIQILSLSGIDYSKIDKLFKKKTKIKDNNTTVIQFDYFDYQISDCKVLLQNL